MICTDDRRRIQLRARGVNGIDSVEVGPDPRELTVVFFGTAPEDLDVSNFRIVGGRRITDIEVVAVALSTTEDPEREDQVRLTVDQPGDLSTYRLCLVDVDGVDPRYSCFDFRFVLGCDDVDCAPDCECEPDRAYPLVEIDYLAKDYASFRQLLLDRLGLIMPQWTERHVPDIGIALVELLAYEGDRLSYHQDAVAAEAYLDTARLRASVRRHARLVDYTLHDGCAARAWVFIEVSDDVVLPAGTVRFAGGSELFEPVLDHEISLNKAHNEIRLWTWGDEQSCVPTGATAATLADGEASSGRVLRLAPGDVLVFEELIGPKTGAGEDRDSSHRQAVRLTSVTSAVDPLFDQPVVEVTWAREDALRFPLCVRARGGPDRADLVVGVARGNVVLVEHGGRAGPLPINLPVAEIGDVPITQRVPFPPSDVVARAQAEWLRDLPERARQRLRKLLRKAAREPLSQRDIDYLTTLFGRRTLQRLHFDQDQRRTLRALVARFGQLLDGKLERLDRLVARATGGYVLTADNEGWEIAYTWGVQEGSDVDPDQPRFHGPAAIATATDPRNALPDMTVVDQWHDVWWPRRDLLDSGPDDRHFVGETDDAGQIHLRFGDGRNGAAFALPETTTGDDRTATARYRIGNGTAGNVGAEAINRTVLEGIDGAGIIAVRNPIPASGGVDPEGVPEASRRAPHDARLRQLRAITAADYAGLAGRAPGVQRAAANMAWTGSWYEAQVAVDAFTDAEAPDWLLDDIRRALHSYRRIGHDLSVAAATLVPIDLTLCVAVKPDYVAGHVRAMLLRLLGSGRDGYFHADRLTFGTPVRISSIVAAGAAVPGVASVDVTRLERLFGPPERALETGILTMRPLEVAQLDNDPTRPENGRLRLDLVGGR